MSEWMYPLFAFFGGIAVNFISLTETRNIPKPERTSTFKDPIYCAWFFGMPILGAGLAYAYQNSGVNLNPILAINIGVSAPLILKSLAGAIPGKIDGQVD